MDKENFLIKEYDSATKLTYHVDELRSKLTGFFITLGGLAAAAFTYILKSDTAKDGSLNSPMLVNIFILLSSFVGTIVILIVARLRSVQLEHFRIVNNIRDHFLKKDKELWNVVELSAETLPRPNRHSGSYFWLLLILLITSYYFFLASYIFIFYVLSIPILKSWIGYSITILVFILTMYFHDKIYIKLARPPDRRIYNT